MSAHRERSRHGLVALVLATLAGGAVAAGPSGEMLAGSCAGCHGTDGSSRGPATPSLAGMKREYFVASMIAYKRGERPATIMGRIAKAYSPEEIKLMAGHFAAQKLERQPQESDARLARQGRELHDRYCEKCHEEGANLAGQPMPYLRFSLDDFSSGRRAMPEKMKARVDEMLKDSGTESFEQLVHYYGSQQ